MAVKKRARERGQSLIEFAILIPVMVGFFMFIVQAEQAISSAIVNQKYARAQLHFLAFNSRTYPEKSVVRDAETPHGRFWLGVSNIPHYTEENPVPEAPTVKVGYGRPPQDDGLARAEFSSDDGGLTARQNVRIRVLAFLCLPPLYLNKNQPLSESMNEETFTAGRFPYCRN